jgi:hypothetical protein
MNTPNILAEIGRILIEAEIERQRRAAAEWQQLVDQARRQADSAPPGDSRPAVLEAFLRAGKARRERGQDDH